MQKEKVSIILPIYNAENYLEECVNSVLNQSYQNIQLILINDGSKDNSWKICQRLRNKDSRILIATQKNSGVSVARNKGLEMADGEWIMFVDPDDKVDSDIVAKLLKKAKEKSSDIVACACYGFNNKTKIVDHFFSGDRLFNVDKSDLYFQLMDPTYGQSTNGVTAIGVPWGKIYKRSFIKKYNLRFDPKLRRMQDNIFNMYAFYYAKNIYYLDKPLYLYRLDHINNYNQKHLTTLLNIYGPIINARYNGLKKIGLFNNSDIFKYYINEIEDVFFIVVNGWIMAGISTPRLKRKVKRLSQQPYFKDLFTQNRINDIKTKKGKLRLFLVSCGMIRTYATLYKISQKLK